MKRAEYYILRTLEEPEGDEWKGERWKGQEKAGEGKGVARKGDGKGEGREEGNGERVSTHRRRLKNHEKKK